MKLCSLAFLTIALFFLNSCEDRSPLPKTVVCDDGLEVKVFYDNGPDMPSKIEFHKSGVVKTLNSDEGHLFEAVVSPDQKWVLLQESIFGDFIFGAEKDVIEMLSRIKSFSKISEKSDHAVYFRFVRWEAPCTAIISFTFNNEEEEWKADLSQRKFARLGRRTEALFEPEFGNNEAGKRSLDVQK
jgi:hypothetical protein